MHASFEISPIVRAFIAQNVCILNFLFVCLGSIAVQRPGCCARHCPGLWKTCESSFNSISILFVDILLRHCSRQFDWPAVLSQFVPFREFQGRDPAFLAKVRTNVSLLTLCLSKPLVCSSHTEWLTNQMHAGGAGWAPWAGAGVHVRTQRHPSTASTLASSFTSSV